ncbi:MAG: hypothetical protein ACJA09_001813 [Alcanivorax sp.]
MSTGAVLPVSRLIRFLAELDVAQEQLPHARFVQRLGQLIDLADAMTLSETLRHSAPVAAVITDISDWEPEAEFLRVRTNLVKGIMGSFVWDKTRSRIRLPGSGQFSANPNEARHEPYVRFYRAHQREMELRTKGLQVRVREYAQRFPGQLSRLAELDRVLAETFAVRTRQCFAVLPALVGSRYRLLLPEQDQSQMEAVAEAGLEQLQVEIRGLLLAELDTRLLPVQGLVEAITEQAGHAA